MNKKIVILLLILGCAFVISAPLPTHSQGLVTCGLMSDQTGCTICDLIALIQRLYNKAHSYFALPIAALMLGYGGFLMVLSGLQGGKPSLYQKGIKVLTTTAIGILLIFCSWLLIDTLLKVIGAYQHANASSFGPWHQITCQAPQITFPKHLGCDKNDQCVLIDGIGTGNECTEDANCGASAQHLGCSDGMCGYIDGPGTNNCIEGNDPICELHKECVGNSCQEVLGSGPDTCDTLGDDPLCTGMALCKGVSCPDSNVDTSKPDTSVNCSDSAVLKWKNDIDRGIKMAGGINICGTMDAAAMIEAIMQKESRGNQFGGSSAKGACGIMQIVPGAVGRHATGCTGSEPSWIATDANPQACTWFQAHVAESVCIATKMLVSFSKYGCNPRDLAAGYNGGDRGAAPSNSCGSIAGPGQCVIEKGQTRETRKWECLYEDSDHTQCNANRSGGSFRETREYVPDVWGCYNHFKP